MLNERNRVLGSLGVCVAWFALLANQFPIDNQVAYCWFYSPEWMELSPSEIASFLAWVGAAVLAGLRAKSNRRWWIVCAACAVIALEESNYGVPYVSALFGEFQMGRSIHNRFEAENTLITWWSIETVAKHTTFTILYVGVPLMVFFRSRSLFTTAPFAVPLVLSAMTLFRNLAWLEQHASSGLTISAYLSVPKHPCVWTEEEMQEFIFAGAILAWLLMTRRSTRSA